MSATYRADHVGSFLRPPELLETVAAHAEQRSGDDELRAAQDRAIEQVLELQRAAGVDVLTDGEYRRSWFAGAWTEAIEGLVQSEQRALAAPAWQGPNSGLATQALSSAGTSGLVVGRKVRQLRRFAQDECAFLREHAGGPFKVTLSGVGSQALRWFREGVTDAVYADRRALVDDLVAILRDEVGLLVQEGVSYVQLDSLVYAIQLTDAAHRERLAAAGVDLDELLTENIEADNASLAPAKAAGVTTGIHMCRGNNRSAWSAEGGYDHIAERAFAELEVDRLLLEYDSERSGGFEPLRFVPADKTVVLGLISTKTPQLESREDLLRRIEEASRHVPIDRLALSPQCGFASTAKGNLLGWDDQRRKLELVVETAREVWG